MWERGQVSLSQPPVSPWRGPAGLSVALQGDIAGSQLRSWGWSWRRAASPAPPSLAEDTEGTVGTALERASPQPVPPSPSASLVTGDTMCTQGWPSQAWLCKPQRELFQPVGLLPGSQVPSSSSSSSQTAASALGSCPSSGGASVPALNTPCLLRVRGCPSLGCPGMRGAGRGLTDPEVSLGCPQVSLHCQGTAGTTGGHREGCARTDSQNHGRVWIWRRP